MFTSSTSELEVSDIILKFYLCNYSVCFKNSFIDIQLTCRTTRPFKMCS